MLVILINHHLYDGGKANVNYPAQLEAHAGANASTYVFVGDLKAAGVSLTRHDSTTDSMKMALYPADYSV